MRETLLLLAGLLAGCAQDPSAYRRVDAGPDEDRERAFAACRANAPIGGGGLALIVARDQYITDCMRARGYQR